MKQMQSFTDQLALVIRNQQPGPPPQVEYGRHATGMWCMQCKQPGYTSQYCHNRQNQNQRNNVGNQQQNQRPQRQNQYGQGNNRGAPPRQNIQNEGKKEYHHDARDGMFRVNVGRKVRMWVVTIAEVGMPRRSEGNRIVVATE